MKNNITTKLLLALLVFGFWSCDPKSKPEENNEDVVQEEVKYTYVVNVEETTKTGAPALQSFVHGIEGDDWLLFAGRTNGKNDSIGGLHNMINNKANGVVGNYTSTSFIPSSFNQEIMVYNVSQDTTWYLNVDTFLNDLKTNLPTEYAADLQGKNIFNSLVISNPLVLQDENGYLYSVGGYGSINNDSNATTYNTYGQVIRIHLASMIKLVKGNTLTAAEWASLFRYGESTYLKSTGAELFNISGTFYLASGHDFGNSAPNFQKYVDAVYAFTLGTTNGSLLLDVVVTDSITDVTDPRNPLSDDSSKFRRRDGPITESLFKNAAGDLISGFTFYGGVFQPGPDSNLKAWNTAIYIHPNGATTYEIDPTYNQEDYNVYACADFSGYDSTKEMVHTFLLGGIGDGTQSADHRRLSPFTNTGLHIEMDVSSTPSSVKTKLDNVYGDTAPPFYGAESIMEVNDALPFVTATDGKTEVIDFNAAFKDTKEITVGYIYGGIEAMEGNPGNYGGGKSTASDKIWKVTLTKTILTM